MHSNGNHWLTAQETAAQLDTTSSEVCRLLSLGRLSGTKQKDPRRAGKSQWLVDPASVLKEEKTPQDKARAQGSAPQARLRSAVMRTHFSAKPLSCGLVVASGESAVQVHREILVQHHGHIT